MTTIAVPPNVRPSIKCPSWCTVPQEEHIADLPMWEGYVIHHSADGPVTHSEGAYPDGTPDETDPPLIYVEAVASDGISIEGAEALARLILEAVSEARA